MITPTVELLLRPLEEFEAIRRRAVRLGERLCDLSYANPYEGTTRATRDVLRRALDRERLLDLQYSPPGGHALVRRAVADDLAARTGLPFAFQDVVLTPGAMAALHVALRSVGGAGDEVVIPTPCWLDYPLYVHALGLRPVLVPLREPGFELDVDAIADAITPRTCAVLASHPSNPAGRNYHPESLADLARALAGAEARIGRPITFIADEAHRDFVAPGVFTTAAAVWPGTLIVYSLGKYHFLQGQRTGYLAVSPRHPQHARLVAEAPRWARVMGFWAPTALMQAAIPDLLRLRHDVGDVARDKAAVMAELGHLGYQVSPTDATFFLYVATPGAAGDFAFVRDLAAAGVLALPAPLFHHRGYFRLSLMGATRMLERGLAVLRRLGAA